MACVQALKVHRKKAIFYKMLKLFSTNRFTTHYKKQLLLIQLWQYANMKQDLD